MRPSPLVSYSNSLSRIRSKIPMNKSTRACRNQSLLDFFFLSLRFFLLPICSPPPYKYIIAYGAPYVNVFLIFRRKFLNKKEPRFPSTPICTLLHVFHHNHITFSSDNRDKLLFFLKNVPFVSYSYLLYIAFPSLSQPDTNAYPQYISWLSSGAFYYYP